MKRRALLIAGAGAGFAARAQPRVITLWVPWPAGSPTDQALRVLAEAAAQRLQQPVQVHNRPGAAGTLAMPLLQQAAPDGLTLAQLPQTVLRAPWLHPVAWDPLRDTTPILQVAGTTFGIAVPATSPWRTLDALLAHAAQRPDGLSIATSGIGSTPHLVLQTLLGRRDARWVHVPYKGANELALAVAAGQVDAAAGSTGFGPFVDDGRLRLLATFGAQRSRRWPGVPTLAELGHGIVALSPWGLAGPRGMAPALVERLHGAFRGALDDPGFRAELAKADQEPAYLGPAAYAAALRAAFSDEQRAIEQLGLARAS
jgi:tripartite-type tricarboxylate transporter receptor subunit TctC